MGTTIKFKIVDHSKKLREFTTIKNIRSKKQRIMSVPKLSPEYGLIVAIKSKTETKILF
jgi:hypothetical protein